MPPKPALTSSFLVSTDAENEVVCPLTNQDGSQCRKRCIGVRPPHSRPLATLRVGIHHLTQWLTPTQQEKRYRSMQEHIRRAHPDFYIPKLPATEESFQLMITTPPSQRPPPQPTTATVPTRKCMFATRDPSGIGLRCSSRCKRPYSLPHGPVRSQHSTHTPSATSWQCQHQCCSHNHAQLGL